MFTRIFQSKSTTHFSIQILRICLNFIPYLQFWCVFQIVCCFFPNFLRFFIHFTLFSLILGTKNFWPSRDTRFFERILCDVGRENLSNIFDWSFSFGSQNTLLVEKWVETKLKCEFDSNQNVSRWSNKVLLWPIPIWIIKPTQCQTKIWIWTLLIESNYQILEKKRTTRPSNMTRIHCENFWQNINCKYQNWKKSETSTSKNTANNL